MPHSQHEGRTRRAQVRRSTAEHRTDYEGLPQRENSVAAQCSFAGVRLGKKGGLGSPQRLLVTFVRTKVTQGPGRGAPGAKAPKRLASEAPGVRGGEPPKTKKSAFDADP